MSASGVHVYVRNCGAFYGTLPAIGETIDEFIDLNRQGFMVYCNSAAMPLLRQRLNCGW